MTPAIARSVWKARQWTDQDYNYGEVAVKMEMKRGGK
jgi:hypothetical protein